MLNYLLKRLGQSIFAIFGITLVVFLFLNVVGDPVDNLVSETASFEEREAVREEYGFNDPLLIRYGRFISGAVRGDFGQSYAYNEPAMKVVLERLPTTLKLALTAYVFALVTGISLGVLSAVWHNSMPDNVIRVLSLIIKCIPSFWLGIMLLLLFAVKLKWFPATGSDGGIRSLVLPAFTLGIHQSSTILRLMRSNMIDVMSREYIDVAKSKGLHKRTIVMKHAFKNAFGSILSLLGMQIASLVGGAVAIEKVFGWGGIGILAVNSINGNDFNVVEAIVTILAVSFAAVNFIVDILYCVVNPRVQVQ